jgi:protein CMS1
VDYITAKIRRKNPDLSALELSELSLAESTIRETSGFSKDRSLNNIQQFLEKCMFGSMRTV